MGDPALRAHLLGSGASESQVDGLEDRLLIGLAGDMELARGLDLTAGELARRCGTSEERVRAVYRALGLDVGALAGFGEGDVELVGLVVGADASFAGDVIDELLRVAGASLRRMAEAAVAAYVQDIEHHPDRRPEDLVGLAELNARASALVVAFADTFGTVFRHHMWTAVRDQRSGQAGVGAPDLIRVGIGFVDLVGFTPISLTASPNELMAVVEDFERRAHDVAARHGARIVKSMGDEVMIVGPDHDTVALVALDLVAGAGGERSSRPRAGVSAGEVVFRLGDYYGPVVNVAARLAADAGPGEILTDVGANPTGSLALRREGPRRLKGFDAPVEVWSVGPGPGRSGVAR